MNQPVQRISPSGPIIVSETWVDIPLMGGVPLGTPTPEYQINPSINLRVLPNVDGSLYMQVATPPVPDGMRVELLDVELIYAGDTAQSGDGPLITVWAFVTDKLANLTPGIPLGAVAVQSTFTDATAHIAKAVRMGDSTIVAGAFPVPITDEQALTVRFQINLAANSFNAVCRMWKTRAKWRIVKA